MQPLLQWTLLFFRWIDLIHACRVVFVNPRNLPMVQFDMPFSVLLVNLLVPQKLLRILDRRQRWMRSMMHC
jgi:hypothetical protein